MYEEVKEVLMELSGAAGRNPHMERVLVVACRTAADDVLLDAVGSRAARSPCEFALLVPRPCHGLHRVVDPEEHGWQEARAVLEIACPLLSEAAGSKVRGLVGSHDPVAAVEDALNMHGFDEAIVSTLPAHLSRWLRLDLPSKVEGMGVPVTRVVGTGLGASRERSVGAGSPGSGLLVR
jgi:hypothetical protein